MKRWLAMIGVAAFWAGMAGTGGAAEPEHCKLELVRLEPRNPNQGLPQKEFLYRNANSHGFYMNFNQERGNEHFERQFKEAVKKEPEKYVAKKPLKAAIKLGDKMYGFALDKKDEESKGFDRLYFDRNGNGDLTDDEPIDALSEDKPRGYPESYLMMGFPRVDLPIEVDEEKLDYSILVSEQGQEGQYIYVSLSPGVYCRGEIELDGKKVPVAVIDYNGNGRFDDVIAMDRMGHGADGELYPQYGDKLLVDPEKAPPRYDPRAPDAYQQYLSKLNALEGKYCEVTVSPIGKELTWKPSTAALGKVNSPHAPCKVELISDLGYLALGLEPSEPAEIPAGEWKLLSYTITIKDWKAPPKKEEPKKEEPKKEEPKKAETAKKSGKKATLLGAFEKVFKKVLPETVKPVPTRLEPLYGPENLSVISARGTTHSEPLTVEAGKTATLKFGPPYKLSVKARQGWGAPGTAYLSLAIVGADGETVSNLYVNGRRPPKPKFTITDPKGEVVLEGNFEYG